MVSYPSWPMNVCVCEGERECQCQSVDTVILSGSCGIRSSLVLVLLVSNFFSVHKKFYHILNYFFNLMITEI